MGKYPKRNKYNNNIVIDNLIKSVLMLEYQYYTTLLCHSLVVIII